MLVLTHVGSDLPEYIQYMFEQTRIHNPYHDVVMLADTRALTNNETLLKKFNIIAYPTEPLQEDRNLQEFHKLSWYDAWGKPNTTYPSPENFVQGTSERLFILEAFMKREGVKDIFHCENDIMLYCDLDDIINKCTQLEGLMFTPMSDIDITCAMMYVHETSDLGYANQFMLDQLAKGDEAVRQEFGMPMVHEMSLLKIYHEWNDGLVGAFPIFPNQRESHQRVFKMIFDPASYGQYHGGTNCGHSEGFTDPIHYVGQAIQQHKIVTYIEDGVPYVQSVEGDHEPVKLANLHIHSKQLQRFLSHELRSI